MATPNVGILTTAGKALIDKVNSGQAKISFSKIVFSSMDNSQLSDTQIKALTAIAPQEVVVSSPETTLDTNSGETRIRATGTNEKLADGVYVKTYGVFAKDDTGNEILYGVTVSPNPNYFPAYDGVTPQAVTYSYKTVIQETSNITMTNSNDVYASQEDLTEAIAAIPLATKADDSKVVHNSGAEEIGGQKTFDVAPIDKTTGNPYITKNGVPTNYAKDNYDGTITVNGTVFNLLKSLSASSIPQDPTKDYNTLPQGLALMSEANGEPANMPPVKSTYLTLTIASSFAGGRKRQLVWLDAGASSSNNNFTYIRYCVGSTWSSWDSIPTSTQISSLIPSTIADTTKLANFTAGLQSGGVSVATSDDLKSVENSAWHQLSMPDCNGMKEITLLYRNFLSDHYMNLYAYGTGIQSNIQGPTMLDLSSLIDKIESVSGAASGMEEYGSNPFRVGGNTEVESAGLVGSGNKVILHLNGIIEKSIPVVINGYDSPFAKVTYDNWIGS